jgi:hypothetical protein
MICPLDADGALKTWSSEQTVSSAEMERMMKVQEVILKAVAGSLKWWEAAEIIGRMVKILECAEGLRFSMMEIENKHSHIGAALGLRYRIGQSGTPAVERVSGG